MRLDINIYLIVIMVSETISFAFNEGEEEDISDTLTMKKEKWK